MKNLRSFLHSLKNKNVHLLGVSGAEGSSLFNLLISAKLTSLTVHDFVAKEALEKNFKLWHKGLTVRKRSILFRKFKQNLKKVKYNDRNSYLKDISRADIIFVPQSWRLYPQNKILFKIRKKGTPFYSLLRLYLDYSPAKIIAVTGTVGKGSVAFLISELLRRSGKTVYFTGNETWTLQLAEKILGMKKSDFLVLEVSHRQILDGFDRTPQTAIITNLYPDHLTEVSWSKYCKVKLSLIKKQTQNQISVINYDNELLKQESEKLKSKIFYFSTKHKEMNIKNVQALLPLLNKINNHYLENALAACIAVYLNGVKISSIKLLLKDLPALPARLEKKAEINNISVFDDIKSTTPWSTLAALDKLSGNTVLIMGGDTKGISYEILVNKLIKDNIKTIILKSNLSRYFGEKFPGFNFIVKQDLSEAVKTGLDLSDKNKNLLISPGAANFYSEFIKGKNSIRKIIASLK